MLLHKSVEFDSRVRREAAALAEAGHEVTVLELAPVPRDAALLEGFHRRSVMPSSWLRRWLPFQLYRIAFLGSFIQEILRLHPDVVHAHDAAMLLPGLVAARLTGARLVYDSHELATSVAYRDRAVGVVCGRRRAPRGAALRRRDHRVGWNCGNWGSGIAIDWPVTPTVVRNVSALSVQGGGDVCAVASEFRETRPLWCCIRARRLPIGVVRRCWTPSCAAAGCRLFRLPRRPRAGL